MALRQVESTLDIPITTSKPVPGAWILFRPSKQYSIWGHTGVVLRTGTSTADVVESNLKAGEVSVRTISLKNPEIRGFYYQPYSLSVLTSE